MIKAIASNMAKNLSKTLNSQENIEVYAYSLQLMLISVINLVAVVLAAFLLQILPTTLAFLAVFIPFRAFGGGVHLSTISRCMIIGSCLMLGSAYLAAQIYIQPYWLDVLFVFTILFTLLCIVKWVPADTKKNPIKDFKLIRMQKRNMLISAIVWTVCVTISIYSNQNTLALSMVLGGMVSTVLMSPSGFYLMGLIDRILNNFGKEVINS